jgi:hypothetical protein
MAPHVTDQIDVLSSSISPASRLSLDPALKRLGVLDGGWWPSSRNATVELPGLVSSLNARLGVVLRLGLDARDWDEIPHRITVDGHVVRVGRFADVNHKIIVTRGRQDHVFLLVVPPEAATAAAKSALALAASGRSSGRPEEILAASGIEHPSRTALDGDLPPDRRPSASEDVHPTASQDAVRPSQRDIGRLDDGAPSPDPPVPPVPPVPQRN